MGSVWAELKRRNVVKVAAAYAIVGWLLVQIADVFFPALQLPEWTVTFVAALLLLGFPVALLLSWAYELTPDGVQRAKAVPLSENLSRVTGRKLDFAIIGLLVLAVVFMFVDNYLPEQGPFAGAEIDPASLAPELDEPQVDASEAEAGAGPSVREVLPNSVAVLPLANLSPDPDNAFFALGIHDTILNELAKLQNMNVIARTSVLQYADGQKTIAEIAEELNVEAVMEGSVQYADGRILVTAQLIDPETSAHLWSDNYDREFEDIFAIQADIAMNIANAVEAEFSVDEQERIEAEPTDSPAAYALYLRALSSLGAGIPVITEYLDRAIELDPEFALAYALKALMHADSLTGNAPAQQAQFEQIVQENAERALALDPTLGSAHGALAFVHQANWNWAEAEREFERALQVSPNDTWVLSPYSRFQRFKGEYEEAIRTGRRAVELDPNTWFVHYQLGINYRYARDHEAAATAFHTVLELTPGYANVRIQLGHTEVSRGNWEDAERELRLAEQIWGDDIVTIRIPQLAMGYAQMGRRDEVERLVGVLEERAQASPVNEAVWALAYIALQDYDAAYEALETAVNDQAPDFVPLGEIKANPHAIPALDEPRFQELRDRIGA